MRAVTTIRLIRNIRPQDEGDAIHFHADKEMIENICKGIEQYADEHFKNKDEIEVAIQLEDQS